ncbi:MAG TPA: site-specific integrase [Aquaticitalea sp.]|nr:site-specific integrase [Aquaticitalea sp.]
MDNVVLPTVVLRNVVHRNAHQICMYFKYDDGLIACARRCAMWSTNLKCWYMPNVAGSMETILDCFENVAIIDSSTLVPYGLLKTLQPKKEERVLTPSQRDVLNRYYRYLQGKRYSSSTVNTYTYLVADFIAYCGEKPLKELAHRDVELFIEDVLRRKSYSISTQRQFISGVKLFVLLYPEVQVDSLVLERPKNSKSLPTVLSQEDMIQLLRCTTNLKHRAVLAMLYSSGLRISELLNLELQHIYVDRKQVLVKNGKGRKDRYVVLADSILPLLHNYVDTFKPQRYFVEGLSGMPYSAGSVRKFLKKYCRKAKIKGTVTPHTLRHSYATHLLEQGVNLRHIQELLGHSKPETTMIYTHVARKDLIAIQSPLDHAVNKITKSEKEAQKVRISGGLKG